MSAETDEAARNIRERLEGFSHPQTDEWREVRIKVRDAWLAVQALSAAGKTGDGSTPQTLSPAPRGQELRSLPQQSTDAWMASVERANPTIEPGTVGVHPETLGLVRRFSTALLAKLKRAEEKYGYTDGWSRSDWEAECRQRLAEHVKKGDPLDVAAYAAFCWHHGWSSTAPRGEEGWVLVPREPTEDQKFMLRNWFGWKAESEVEFYRKLLAAAPKAPGP